MNIKTGKILSSLHEVINFHIQGFSADWSLFLVRNFLHWTILLSTSDDSMGFPRCEALITPDYSPPPSTSPSLVDFSSLEPRDRSAPSSRS